MKFWQRILIDALLFLAIAGFFRNSFQVSSVWYALVASLVLAILNAAIKPFLVILSLPITFLTLGLFSIVINAAMLELTSFFVGAQNFQIANFGMAMLAAVIMSICNAIISSYFNAE
ncbi:phage holin family protein [Furfurilactobacillus curtus]|uniref:Membrane protein n=1 Tax=Furfurilactobacillus curtus TaxID=1746200 RepID=A0ABQ5JNH4_9LACO